MTDTKAKHTPSLTSSELIFARRMLPHFLAGKSAGEAARAVLDDDARLFNAVMEVGPVGMCEGAQGDGSPKLTYGLSSKSAGIRAELIARVRAAIAKAEGR